MKKIISLLLVLALSLTTLPTLADDDGESSSSGGSGAAGAVAGLVLVALLVWALTPKKTSPMIETNKPDPSPLPQATQPSGDTATGQPGGTGGGIGVNNKVEY